MQKFHFFSRKHPILFCLALAAGSIFIFGISFYFYVAYLLPLPDLFQHQQQVATTKIYDRHGKILYEVLQPDAGKKTIIPLNQIPQYFIQATLAAEDINFYQHGGIDPGAILRAIIFNVKEQRVVSGASTITQQLVRNILGFNRDRGFTNKVMEALYAVRLSHVYSKDQIFELYLNKIYYGNLAYGSESAALDYFGKHIFDLDLAESTLLAGLPQAPSAYNPFIYFDKAKKRQKYVLDQMVKYKFITQENADAANNEPLHLRHNIAQMKAPHFVQYVLNNLDDQFGNQVVSQGGLSVYTTLDLDLELKAEATVSRHVQLLKEKQVTNGALLALEPSSGQILAWVGSENYYDEKIDGAVDMITALRQPGSSIKPFNYLLALEKGYTPATILDDIPTEFSTESGPYTPKNYDLSFHGPVRLRNALASSFNIPAVKVLDYVGVESFIGFLRNFGIETLEQSSKFYGLALTLGGGEVRLFDMAGAYNVIANYGLKRDLSSILKVENANGKSLYEWSLPQGENVLGTHGREHAYQIIDILKDPLARLGGFGEGSILELSHPAAVKTGTTRNFRDNWTIGFTPQILTTVWVGNADASSMHNITGIDGAGPIWHDFMEGALKFSENVAFSRPSKLKQVEICSLSGKLPTDFCADRVFEWFVPGTEPKKPDDYSKKFWVMKASGNIVSESCVKDYPANLLEEKVLIAYPAQFQKWAAGKGLALPKMQPCAKSALSDGYPNGYSNGYPPDYSDPKLTPENQQEAQQLLIDSPDNFDEYMIDLSLPLKDQRIPFRLTVPLNAVEMRFFVDGKLIASQKDFPFTYLWLPVVGKHKLLVEGVLSDKSVIKTGPISFEIKK